MAVAAMVAMAVGPLAVGTPAPNGGTHIGYVDKFVVNTEQVPSNWVAVRGPSNAWRVEGNVLQAVQVAGTVIELVDQNVPLDLVGNQLMGLCLLPEQTINSAFYSGFTVNEAPLVDLLLGTVKNLLTLRLNVPLDQLQILDQAGNLLATVPLPKNLQFNQWTCLNVLILSDVNELVLILGNTLDTLGHVVNGVTTRIDLDQIQNFPGLPEGSVGLAQPISNTARVLFRDLHVQTTPDLPLDVQAFAGPGNGQITLVWDPPQADGGTYVTGYNVYRGTSPDFDQMTLVGTVLGGYETEFTDRPYTGLVPSTQKYFYRVTANNLVGEGPLSVAECGIPYPMGLLLLENSGLGCGSHGLVEGPTLEPLL